MMSKWRSPKPIIRARDDKPYEMRVVGPEDTELRSLSVDGDEQRYVEGYGIIWDRETEIYSGYYEKINKNAFDKSLAKNKEIKSYINHSHEQVLSTTKSTPALQLEVREKGLWFKSPIPDTTYGRDLMELLRRGTIRGASFMFSINKNGETIRKDDKGFHREIVDAELFEIGPVLNPAYPQTKVGLRSIEDVVNEIRESVEETEYTTESMNENVVIDTIEKVEEVNKLNLKKKKITLYSI